MLTLTERIEQRRRHSAPRAHLRGRRRATSRALRPAPRRGPRLAAGLQALGVGPGDHVALLGPTTRPLVTAIQAIWLAGGTVVVLPLPMRMGSIEEFVGPDPARITQRRRRRSCSSTPSSPPFIEPAPGDPPMVGWDAIEPGHRPRRPPTGSARPTTSTALAILQFTSGSTSDPKGVMLPHRTVCANLDAIADGDLARPRRRRAGVVAAAVPRHGPRRAAHARR